MICPHCQQERTYLPHLVCDNCKLPLDTSKLSNKYLLKLKRKAGLIPNNISWFEKVLQGKNESAWEAIQRKEAEKLKKYRRNIKRLEKASVSVSSNYKPAPQHDSGAQGNFIFIVLHVMAVLFGFFLLFFTIPAHLIYLALVGKK